MINQVIDHKFRSFNFQLFWMLHNSDVATHGLYFTR